MDILDEFCGSPFWNTTLTWETETPDFTPCFEKTVVAWAPCLFLWILSPLEIHYIRSSTNGYIRWNWLNVTKVVLTVVTLVLSVANIAYSLADPSNAHAVDYVTPAVKMVSQAWAIFLLSWNRKRGLRTSGLITLFWLLTAAGSALEFRTQINAETSERPSSQLGQLPFYTTMIFFPAALLIFVLNCFVDAEPTKSAFTKIEDRCPEFDSSFLAKMFFLWYDKMAWKGFRKTLDHSDLWELNSEDTSVGVVPVFFKNFNKESDRADSRSTKTDHPKKRVSVLCALFKSFGATFVFAALMELAGDTLQFVSPQILKLLIRFTSGIDAPLWKGLLYAFVLFITAMLQSVLLSQYNYRMYLVGMRVRTALIAAIYRKSLRMSNVARKDKTAGEIVTLMSVDAQRFLEMGGFVVLIWSAPFQIILALYFLWNILGVAVLAGLASMIILIPINAWIAAKMKILQITQMKNKDERAKLMNEILNGIKVLKLYGWEPPFASRIDQIRTKEVEVLRQSAYLQAGISFAFTVAPFLVTLVSFTTYVLIDEKNVLDAQTAFVSLSLFNILRLPLAMLPIVVMMVIQSAVSIKRIDKFLNSEDLDFDCVAHDAKDGAEAPLKVEDGSFAWGPGESPILKNINLQVPKGSLVAVVGAVGSGKTSLLCAMLGEMEKQSGRVNSVGSIAYVSQQAWIQNATLRDNILFAKAHDPRKYSEVVEACALTSDLAMLAAGDQTEIGEKGINLSGGQKQRVSLARAVYNDAEMYLLDDPLSAVDSHVGKHIFEQVIGPGGLLRNKTRVLVTHGISYLPMVDRIVVLKDGTVSEEGTYEELLLRKGAFAEFLVQHLQEAAEEDDVVEDLEEIKVHLEKAVGREELQRRISQVSSTGSDGVRSRRASDSGSLQRNGSSLRRRHPAKLEVIPPQGTVVGERLTEDESLEVGSVKLEVFIYYIKSISFVLCGLTILFNVLLQVVTVFSSLWVTSWTSDPVTVNPLDPEFEPKRNMYLGVYAAYGFAQAVFSMTSSFVFAMGSIASSVELHKRIFQRTLHCPMSFFDVTPMGRILNRFTKDIDNIDNVLPLQIRQCVSLFFTAISTIVVVSYGTPIFLAVVFPLFLFYFIVQRFYVATSRQLKRLDAVTRSPIYTHFSETLTGASCIRAYGAVDRFVGEVESRVDINQKCYFPLTAANRWVSLRLETVGNLIIFFAALFAVLGRDTIDPSIVGLSVSYSLQITLVLNWLVRILSDAENNIISVERIKEYEDTPQEASWEDTKPLVDASWPSQGTVEFKDYEVRYREGLDLVLRGINVSVKGGEKVGIVGRTGAGKSSLTLGLFRIVEAAGGQILIDGVDIGQLGLHTVRSRLTIIPQDPVIFTGSLRVNLDPYNSHTDEEIWRALERSHLKVLVQSFAAGLNHEMNEGGENLSVGQRQLVCLARALLRKTKILVFDEATAAIDLETDDLIQKTIREDFRDCTILTIAHRLNTIMDSDRVLVLDQGQIAEFNSPPNLLQKKSSLFYSLAKDAGLV